MELDKIYNEDCLEGMKRIPDGTIDAVICDLPYGTTANKWDSIIPLDQLWAEYKRIVKKGAPILLFGSEPFSTKLRMSNMEWWRYDWIWKKTKSLGFLHAKNAPLKNYEIISAFCREGYGHVSTMGENRMTYNPQGLRPCHKIHKGTDDDSRSTSLGGGTINRTTITEWENYPQAIIEFDNDSDGWHPTQKPVDLLRYLVLTYTNEGDTVLDNCMGSGTTAIACIREKRHFIGFELNKDYYDKACKRIDNEQRQQTLF